MGLPGLGDRLQVPGRLGVNDHAPRATGAGVFHGTLDGTSMSGSVTTGLGTFQFSGSKAR